MSNSHTEPAVPHRADLNQFTGRWLGKRGIFRHFQPTDDEALAAAREAGAPVQHVMSTCLSGVFDGDVTGELIRWADPDGTIYYNAVVNGLPDSNGLADLFLENLTEMCDLTKVLQGLRYEWGAMVVYEDWAVSRMSIYTGPRTGGA